MVRMVVVMVAAAVVAVGLISKSAITLRPAPGVPSPKPVLDVRSEIMLLKLLFF